MPSGWPYSRPRCLKRPSSGITDASQRCKWNRDAETESHRRAKHHQHIAAIVDILGTMKVRRDKRRRLDGQTASRQTDSRASLLRRATRVRNSAVETVWVYCVPALAMQGMSQGENRQATGNRKPKVKSGVAQPGAELRARASQPEPDKLGVPGVRRPAAGLAIASQGSPAKCGLRHRFAALMARRMCRHMSMSGPAYLVSATRDQCNPLGEGGPRTYSTALGSFPPFGPFAVCLDQESGRVHLWLCLCIDRLQ